jgi:hypothetical protein
LLPLPLTLPLTPPLPLILTLFLPLPLTLVLRNARGGASHR